MYNISLNGSYLKTAQYIYVYLFLEDQVQFQMLYLISHVDLTEKFGIAQYINVVQGAKNQNILILVNVYILSDVNK